MKVPLSVRTKTLYPEKKHLLALGFHALLFFFFDFTSKRRRAEIGRGATKTIHSNFPFFLAVVVSLSSFMVAIVICIYI